MTGREHGQDPERAREAERPPGPPDPPLVPGHLGSPTYRECADMLIVMSVYEASGVALPPDLAWKLGPWKTRLREWGRREVERGNLDALIALTDEAPGA
jgi:hypothetical protein